MQFKEQEKDPKKGDWTVMVAKDLSDFGMNQNMIKMWSKNQLKKQLKIKTKEIAINELNEKLKKTEES